MMEFQGNSKWEDEDKGFHLGCWMCHLLRGIALNSFEVFHWCFPAGSYYQRRPWLFSVRFQVCSSLGTSLGPSLALCPYKLAVEFPIAFQAHLILSLSPFKSSLKLCQGVPQTCEQRCSSPVREVDPIWHLWAWCSVGQPKIVVGTSATEPCISRLVLSVAFSVGAHNWKERGKDNLCCRLPCQLS